MFSAQDIADEGKKAIESPTSPNVPDLGPEGYQMGKSSQRIKLLFLNIYLNYCFLLLFSGFLFFPFLEGDFFLSYMCENEKCSHRHAFAFYVSLEAL